MNWEITSGFNSNGEPTRELTSTYYAQTFMEEEILEIRVPVSDVESKVLADEITKILLRGGEVFDVIGRLREAYVRISEGPNTRKLNENERYDIMIDRVTDRMFTDMCEVFESYGDGKTPTRKQVETWVRIHMVSEFTPEFGIHKYFVRVGSFNPFVFVVSD